MTTDELCISDWSSYVCTSDRPGNRFRVWGLQKFLFSCAKDPKFSAEFVVPEIDRAMRARGENLGLLERRVIYPVAIALMRDRLLMLAGRFEPLMEYPQWGPGRVDTFNAAKVIFNRSEEHTSELQSLMRHSYAVFCLQKKKHKSK